MNTVELLHYDEIADADYVVSRIGGWWRGLSTGMDGDVNAIAIANDGTVYLGGDFMTAGGVTVNYVCAWDGTQFLALGSGTVGVSGTVNALAVDSLGRLYVGGSFVTAGGVTVNQIAMYDGTWHALGAGTPGIYRAAGSAYVGALAIDRAGQVYLGGNFDKVGGAGGTVVNNVAMWDGSAFSALGSTPGTSDAVAALAIGSNGVDVYVGGGFTTAGGVTVNSIAKWDGSATWAALGDGVAAGSVYALAVAPNGVVFAGGNFSTIGGVAAAKVAAYNGSAWAALGAGLTGGAQVEALFFDSLTGTLYAGGNFTAAGGISVADRIASWSGSAWSLLGIDLPGSPIVNAIAGRDDSLYLGYQTAGTATIPGGPVTDIINTGSARTFPRFIFARSGGTSATLQLIENITTGDKLLFEYALLDGEELVIDLTPGRKTITSSAHGNVLNALLDVSDFGSFCLESGANDIAIYMTEVGSPTITALIQWETQFASLDGAAS